MISLVHWFPLISSDFHWFSLISIDFHWSKKQKSSKIKNQKFSKIPKNVVPKNIRKQLRTPTMSTRTIITVPNRHIPDPPKSVHILKKCLFSSLISTQFGNPTHVTLPHVGWCGQLDWPYSSARPHRHHQPHHDSSARRTGSSLSRALHRVVISRITRSPPIPTPFSATPLVWGGGDHKKCSRAKKIAPAARRYHF